VRKSIYLRPDGAPLNDPRISPCGCFTVYRMTRNESVAEEERGEFVDASVMAQTVATIESIAEYDDEEPMIQGELPA